MYFKLISISFCLIFISQPVIGDDLSELKAQLSLMQHQIQAMQAKLDAQETLLKKQEQVVQEINHQQAAGHTGSITTSSTGIKSVAHEVADSIAINGVVEVVANHTGSDSWSDESASDIVLDTFELGIEASAGDWVSASVLFLYEDADDDNLNVDEGFITIANSQVTPWYASIGRLYVPFGYFESNMISDPVTLTLGETREDVIQVGFEMDTGFYGSAYVFNGDAEEAESDYSSVDNNNIDNYGMNFGYAMESDDFGLDIGVGYINNIATSDTLQDAVDDNVLCAGDGCIKDYVGGMSVYARATIGQFNLIGEYMTAMDDFEAGEISSVNSDKLKPEALNIEGAYNFELAGKNATLALGYQKTKDLFLDTETTDFFEKAWLASISVNIINNTMLSAEWRHADGYSEVKNAHLANNDKFDNEDLLQLKLSYEF